jgi:hypothetical protein
MPIGRLVVKGARSIGRSPGRAAAAGFGGGVLLDDVPVIGKGLDPTEKGDTGTVWILAAGVVALIGLNVFMVSQE